MRPVIRSLHAVAAWAVITILVVACASPAASSASPAPSGSPAASPSSAVVPTPSPAPPASTEPSLGPIGSPDPSFSEVSVECIDYLVGCALHRTNDQGEDAPGWPIELDGNLVDLTWNDLTYGCGLAGGPFVRGGIDDLTFVGVVARSGPEIRAYESNGQLANGWPQPFPAPDGGCHGVMLSPSEDRLIAWGYEGVVPDMELIADRTEFTIFELDGTVLPGWPRGSEGAASGPRWFGDGIAYVSGTGRVWAHGADGEVRPGWGYRLASKDVPVTDGHRLAFIQLVPDIDDALLVLGDDGQPVAGFPAALDGEVETLCLYGDTPCVGEVDPALAPDGTVIIALGNPTGGVVEEDPTGGAIEAIGPDGRLVAGWPVRLPEWGHVSRLTWSPEGAVVATVVVCAPIGCSDVERVEEHWYGMNGRLIEVRPIEGDVQGAEPCQRSRDTGPRGAH